MNYIYEVKGETHEGKTLTLRRGFTSRAAAESYPVTMRYWKRVWVETIEPPPPEDGPPPLPWSVQWGKRGLQAYIIDANGKKIASLLGTTARRRRVAAIIEERLGA